MNLNKTQVARRQLGTALALFLADQDPVSVHTLACAGCEVVEHITRKAGAKPFSSHALATIPNLDIKELRKLQNQFWNAFKHATTRGGRERQDKDLLERFNDETNDHTLFVGWYDYMLGTGKLPIEAQAFQAWYFALYPEKLNPEVDATKYARLFPAFQELSRADQKKALNSAIAAARQNHAVMDDPRTERSPLVLTT